MISKKQTLQTNRDQFQEIIEEQGQISIVQGEKIENQATQENKNSKLNHSQIQQEWSEYQLQMTRELYKQYGPCWTFMSTKLQNRDYKNIKNRFNNGLRKAAKILYHCQGQTYKNTKKSITYEMILIMLSFINQLQRSIKNFGLTVNYEGKFFIFRQEILKISLSNKTYQKEKIVDVVKLMKNLNLRIRCFGVFKSKCKKNWTLSRKGLSTLCQFDRVVLQQQKIKVQQGSTASLISSLSDKKLDSKIQSEILSPFYQSSQLLDLTIDNFPINVQRFTGYQLDKELCQIQGNHFVFPLTDNTLFY